MKVIVLKEEGYTEAMLGLSLSYNQDPANMPKVAERLAHRNGGHNKFLESIAVWIDLTAPRYFWVDFDAYRIGITKQSETTQHGWSRPLTQLDFEQPILPSALHSLNLSIEAGNWMQLKNELPEGFRQRRIVCLNYKTLRHILGQRHDHRLREWHYFCNRIFAQVEYPEFVDWRAADE